VGIIKRPRRAYSSTERIGHVLEVVVLMNGGQIRQLLGDSGNDV
jgi:hypothetical protein